MAVRIDQPPKFLFARLPLPRGFGLACRKAMEPTWASRGGKIRLSPPLLHRAKELREVERDDLPRVSAARVDIERYLPRRRNDARFGASPWLPESRPSRFRPASGTKHTSCLRRRADASAQSRRPETEPRPREPGSTGLASDSVQRGVIDRVDLSVGADERRRIGLSDAVR